MPDTIRAQAVADDNQVRADAEAKTKADASSPAEQLIRFVRSSGETSEDSKELATQTSQDIMVNAAHALVAQANLSQQSVLAMLLK